MKWLAPLVLLYGAYFFNSGCENQVASVKGITHIVADDKNQFFRCCGNDGMYVCMYVCIYVCVYVYM